MHIVINLHTISNQKQFENKKKENEQPVFKVTTTALNAKVP